MAFHTVLIPPSVSGAPRAAALEKAVFLKDGFVLSAFLFTGLWLLAKRLWLAFAIFAAVWLALIVGGPALGLHPMALLAAQALIGLFLGLEGNALVERKLLRKGWTLAGVVEGGKTELVERRFFEAAGAGGAQVMPAQPAAMAPSAPRPAQPVVGLFPEPSARRP